MEVSEAVRRRMSVRAFRPDPVPAAVVREILELARASPSGGNLQPWRVHALAGDALADLKTEVARAPSETPEYAVYPERLWEPFRTRRYQCGEDLYARDWHRPRGSSGVVFVSWRVTWISSARQSASSSASTATWDRRNGRISACICRR